MTDRPSLLRVGKSVCFLWPDLEKRNSSYFVAGARWRILGCATGRPFPSNLSQSRPLLALEMRETPTARGGGLSLPKRRG